MLLHRTRRVTARAVQTIDGAEVLRLQMTGPLTFLERPLFTRREDFTPNEAATLGASMLGWAITQGGLAREYALSVMQQLSWDAEPSAPRLVE